jgi:hypothetical protein
VRKDILIKSLTFKMMRKDIFIKSLTFKMFKMQKLDGGGASACRPPKFKIRPRA